MLSDEEFDEFIGKLSLNDYAKMLTSFPHVHNKWKALKAGQYFCVKGVYDLFYYQIIKIDVVNHIVHATNLLTKAEHEFAYFLDAFDTPKETTIFYSGKHKIDLKKQKSHYKKYYDKK